MQCREDKEEAKKGPPLAEVEPEAPELDEDGYVIRRVTQQSWSNEKSFYSSSDSDSGRHNQHVECHGGKIFMLAVVELCCLLYFYF